MTTTPLDVYIADILDDKLGSSDPYKQYAPAVKTPAGYTIHINDDIVEPSEYSRVVDILRNATEADVITLYITTCGGSSDTADLLFNNIRKSKAHVVARTAGIVASAGTIIFAACDEFEVPKTTAFLFHEGVSYSGPMKPSDSSAHTKFFEKHKAQVFQTYYGNLLTPKEHKSILAGTELWLDGAEVIKRLQALGNKVNQGE